MGTAGQQITVSVAAPGHLTRAESYVFSPDGKLKHKAGLTDGNAGMRIYGMLKPLHYGTCSGLPLKIIYAVLGAGLTLTVATCGNIWLARRRDQGRPAPLLDRLWTGLLCGQPLALTLPAVGEAAGLARPLPVYWTTTLLIWIAMPASPSGYVARLLRIATGAALLVLAGTQVLINGLENRASIGIDLLWFALALAVLLPVWRSYSHRINATVASTQCL